jgi:hypothetical protein
MAVRDAGSIRWLRTSSQPESESAASTTGHIILDAKPSGKRSAGRSSQQDCNPAGVSPAMSVTHVEHVAMPHPGVGNHPGYAWCKRPGCSATIVAAAVDATWGPSE